MARMAAASFLLLIIWVQLSIAASGCPRLQVSRFCDATAVGASAKTGSAAETSSMADRAAMGVLAPGMAHMPNLKAGRLSTTVLQPRPRRCCVKRYVRQHLTGRCHGA